MSVKKITLIAPSLQGREDDCKTQKFTASIKHNALEKGAKPEEGELIELEILLPSLRPLKEIHTADDPFKFDAKEETREDCIMWARELSNWSTAAAICQAGEDTRAYREIMSEIGKKLDGTSARAEWDMAGPAVGISRAISILMVETYDLLMICKSESRAMLRLLGKAMGLEVDTSR